MRNKELAGIFQEFFEHLLSQIKSSGFPPEQVHSMFHAACSKVGIETEEERRVRIQDEMRGAMKRGEERE